MINTLLNQLIAVDSSTPTGKKQIVDVVCTYLLQQQLIPRVIYNAQNEPVAIWTDIGCFPQKRLLFSGHLDTVPIGTGWNYPPLECTRQNNCIFGRGTTDMKGAVAVLLALVPQMRAVQKNFSLCFTLDEENDLPDKGVLHIFNQSFFKPESFEGCIVAEPTENQIICGHKSMTSFQLTIWGKEAHSATPQEGINALTGAMQAHQVFYETVRTVLTQTDAAYAYPTAIAELTSCQTNTPSNVIPGKAVLAGTGRFINPTQQALFFEVLQQRLSEMATHWPAFKIEAETVLDMPAFEISPTHPFILALTSVASLANPLKVSYATEAGYFAAQNIPTCILGPGSIQQAHQPDEFIHESQLMTFYQIMQSLIKRA